MSIQNPLPRPETVSEEINNEIKNIITYKISRNELDFHTMTDFFEGKIAEEKLDYAKICGYYLINVIISSKALNDRQKNELIGSVCRDISNLNIKLNPVIVVEE